MPSDRPGPIAQDPWKMDVVPCIGKISGSCNSDGVVRWVWLPRYGLDLYISWRNVSSW